MLPVVIVGHVDHGKSSLIGRLLHDTNSLPDGRLEELKAASVRRSMPLEWSFLVDALQIERDQAVTIDSTRIWFKTSRRDYMIIDAPGHREFLRNMITAAAGADAAILVVDASEGARDQTRRHSYLISLFGIRHVVVAINKMDLVEYNSARFSSIARDVTDYLSAIGLAPAAIIPISARAGDNVATRSSSMSWYGGPTIVDALDKLPNPIAPVELPLRLPVQDIYKFDHRRIIVGRIETGVLNVGDRVLFSPSNRESKIRSIEVWDTETIRSASAGRSVGVTLEDEVFIERGEIISHISAPPVLTRVFDGTIFWLGSEPLSLGRKLTLRLATRSVSAVVKNVSFVIDIETLGETRPNEVTAGNIAKVVIQCSDTLAADENVAAGRLGRFVLFDGCGLVAGGLISIRNYPDQRSALTIRSDNITAVAHPILRSERASRNGHTGGVLWFTGLSGSGKSTLAMAVERELFARGFLAYVLDGDNLRHGLNANLGFTPEDRSENVRRVGEAASLFADAGLICITATISPYISDRSRARAAAKTAFHEIYICADLETCEKRDPKGLYKRARTGEILNFTGVSAPYEVPEEPEAIIDTKSYSIGQCVEQIVNYVERNFRRTT